MNAIGQVPTEYVVLPALAVSVVVTVFSWVALAYWIYSDAAARGSSNPVFWGISALFGPMFFVYLVVRWRSFGERTRSPSDRELYAKTFVTAVLAAFVLGAVLTPPDPTSQILSIPLLLAVTLPLAYLLVYREGYARLRARFA